MNGIITLRVKYMGVWQFSSFLGVKENVLVIAYTTVTIQSFRTNRPGQTVQTQIWLLLKEQSDQGLHCLPFCLHRLDSLVYGKAT